MEYGPRQYSTINSSASAYPADALLDASHGVTQCVGVNIVLQFGESACYRLKGDYLLGSLYFHGVNSEKADVCAEVECKG